MMCAKCGHQEICHLTLREKNAEFYRTMAIETHHEEGVLEIDEDAELSDSGDKEAGGCYVQAWVWVDDPKEVN